MPDPGSSHVAAEMVSVAHRRPRKAHQSRAARQRSEAPGEDAAELDELREGDGVVDAMKPSGV